MGRQLLLLLLAAVAYASPIPLAQSRSSEQVQVSTPPLRRAEAPSPDATIADLEQRADTLRAEKSYLDALDYYHAALAKDPANARLYNKVGIDEMHLVPASAKRGRVSSWRSGTITRWPTPATTLA